MTAVIIAALAVSCGLFTETVEAVDETEADTQFQLVDFATDETAVLGTFDSYEEADAAFEERKDDYENLGIVMGDTVYECEYGLVYIYSTDGCDVNVSYTETETGNAGYINGCYGKDALYLGTSDDGLMVDFMISGVKGEGSIEDLTITPIENVAVAHSCYETTDSTLDHLIKSSMDVDYYASRLSQLEIPDGLVANATYESYDGHYFYEEGDIQNLTDDVKAGTHAHAINSDAPYYNYYQFVTHRTLSAYSEADLNDYLTSIGIDAPMDTYEDISNDSVDDTLSRSQFYGAMDSFFEYQYMYGANALMMISLAANESAFGRSSLSFTRNNLFGHSAYDTDVEANASRYLNVDNSVYAHAKYYISSSYSSPAWENYRGSFFGNKASGMNVMYASDPYWGEKAAQYYAQIDASLGSQDFHSATLGIHTKTDSVVVYSDAKLKKRLYTTPKGGDYAFVILEEGKDYYKIQSETGVTDETYGEAVYDFADHVAYIKKSAVSILIAGNEETQTSQDYVKVVFDGNGGTFTDGAKKVTYELPKGSSASCTTPQKENALFTGWSQDVDSVTKDITVKAQYEETTGIEMNNVPKSEYAPNERIDLKGGSVTVNFADGHTEEVSLTTSMVSGFDMSEEGSQNVTVTYAGCETEYEIEISESYSTEETEEEISNEIATINDLYFTVETLSRSQRNEVLALKEKADENGMPALTIGNIRVFDAIVKKAYGDDVLYMMDENDWNFGISGLSSSFAMGDSLDKNWLNQDEYHVHLSDEIPDEDISAFQRAANGQYADIIQRLNITITKNFSEVHPDSPLVMSIEKPGDYMDGYQMLVLHREADGDIKEAYVRQTATRLTWLAEDTGEYVILAKAIHGSYTGDDVTENLTFETSSVSYRPYILAGAVILIILIILVIVLIHRRHKIMKRRKQKRKKIRQKNKQGNEQV